MFIETYQVEMQDGRKVIHYNGFTWARGLYEGIVNGRRCDKSFAATEGTFCYVEVGDDNYERACAEFEDVKQYVYELDEGELLAYEGEWKPHPRLHMDDVTPDTPCGMYWFES